MIYAVIIDGDDVHVKIGKTRGPTTNERAMRQRLSSLQCGSPHQRREAVQSRAVRPLGGVW